MIQRLPHSLTAVSARWNIRTDCSPISSWMTGIKPYVKEVKHRNSAAESSDSTEIIYQERGDSSLLFLEDLSI